jgi:mono/diheme cytochrome c family protein
MLCAAAPAASEQIGRVLFASHCASCHGIDARGGGPVASALLTKPPDLTRLDRNFGSPLSRDKVASYIDGRMDVLAHGPREMPVWGERFGADLGPGQIATEDTTRHTIEMIVEYLVSIQQLQDAWAPSAEDHGSAG